MVSNQKANQKLALQYTSDEPWHNLNFDKTGMVTMDETANFENVFVEGLPYRRKVAKNGKPLTEKKTASGEKRYEQTVDERRKMSTEDKRKGLHFTVDSSMPMCCLIALFENQLARHELLDGRDTLVVESKPMPDAKPALEAEKSALNWKQTTWIDAQETMPVRWEVEKLNDEGHMAKGTKLLFDYIRMVDLAAADGDPEQAVWLQSNFIGHFRMKMLWTGFPGTTEQTWSNFKRFHVDMRFSEDTVQEIPKQGNNHEQTPNAQVLTVAK